MDTIKTDNGGLRYNTGKAPIHLIPPEVIEAHAEHYRKGAEKYEPRNWERGMDWSKCYDSLMRHSLAWMRGEDIDPENGSHHMVAVMWNAAALYWYWLKKVGKDDRPTYTAAAGPMPGHVINMPFKIDAFPPLTPQPAPWNVPNSQPPFYSVQGAGVNGQMRNPEAPEHIEVCGKRYS